MAIRFMKHYVTDGVTKVRVSYSAGQIYVDVKAGAAGGLRECITLYAKDYSDALGKVFPGKYENDTDLMTDYFDEGRVRIFPGDALYEAAKARAEANAADSMARYESRQARAQAKMMLARSVARGVLSAGTALQ